MLLRRLPDHNRTKANEARSTTITNPSESTNPHISKNTMSAPNQGRQSPEPERQSDSQKNPHGAAPNQQGGAPSLEHGKEQSDKQKGALESNPKGPLEDAAKEKTSKQ
ncbi:hypothetical protein CAC42_2745 [Sphaceloma murrayae]|uniref:Uncharacterized protein n=1 Tax=Sphaceloma murrayae TaxID=2082308 RepID=A0A2K1R0J2_9PEZI|nr:hypothetical protein CAC42_2745 [Sphaceloma murrayae]